VRQGRGGWRGAPRGYARWGRAPARPAGDGRLAPARLRRAQAGGTRERAIDSETEEGRVR
jgi:hypothetical protein